MLRGQARQQMGELGHARAVDDVGRHGEVVPSPQGVVDERRQAPTGADLDEDPDAVAVHRLDRLAEPDRMGPLVAHERGRLVGSSGKRSAVTPEYMAIRGRRSLKARSG